MVTLHQRGDHSAEQLRDALRGEFQLLGAPPEAVTVVWPDDRPRIALQLTPMVARWLVDRLDPSTLQARTVPTMVLFDQQSGRLGQVLAATNEYVSLDRIGPSRTWRAPLANLRPPLFGEVQAAFHA